MKISVSPGEIELESVRVLFEGAQIVRLAVDCRTKYPEVVSAYVDVHRSSASAGVSLCARDEHKTADGPSTIITIEDPFGPHDANDHDPDHDYDVFAHAGRYAVDILILRDVRAKDLDHAANWFAESSSSSAPSEPDAPLDEPDPFPSP